MDNKEWIKNKDLVLFYLNDEPHVRDRKTEEVRKIDTETAISMSIQTGQKNLIWRDGKIQLIDGETGEIRPTGIRGHLGLAGHPYGSH